VNTGAGAVDLPAFDHLVFTGSPLKVAETIGGAATARLLVSLSDPSGAKTPLPVDTNFVVHLYDESPSGGRTLITRGYLKASHRWSHSILDTIPLGPALEYRVPMWHVNYRVATGHHLVLTLGSGDPECCLSAAPALAQPLRPLKVTVATGTGGSSISLPVST
jgi:predicted acyl esterase